MPLKKYFSLPVLIVLMISAICLVMVGIIHGRANRYSPFITAASARHGLDPYLVKALVKRESNFRAGARGDKNELGLMQVTPAVSREYAARHGIRTPFPAMLLRPDVNTEIGCWYLAKAMKRYRGYPDPVPFALAHYNAGAANVDRWIRSTRTHGNAREFMAAITYPGTRAYVRSVTRHWKWYRFFHF